MAGSVREKSRMRPEVKPTRTKSPTHTSRAMPRRAGTGASSSRSAIRVSLTLFDHLHGGGSRGRAVGESAHQLVAALAKLLGRAHEPQLAPFEQRDAVADEQHALDVVGHDERGDARAPRDLQDEAVD